MRCLSLVLFWLSLSGCFATSYLSQAAQGQYQLLHQARSLTSLRDDPSISPETRDLLSKVPALKRFAQFHGLTPTSNYTDFVDLHRSAAVWVVQASPRLSLEPHRWHFPIVGSVPYLGFFHEEDARTFAERLAAQENLDVTVRTAGAYSTLGWFRDPVLSTMILEGPTAFATLANTILHESVHATVYVPNQSAFNESLASFVADELTWDLMVGRHGLHAEPVRAWLAQEARGDRFVTEMHRAYEELAALYGSSLPDSEKLKAKEERLTQLQKTLGLRRRYNNADLAGSRTYDTGRPVFERLRRACGSWPRFVEAVRAVEVGDFQLPQQSDFGPVAERLLKRRCRQ